MLPTSIMIQECFWRSHGDKAVWYIARILIIIGNPEGKSKINTFLIYSLSTYVSLSLSLSLSLPLSLPLPPSSLNLHILFSWFLPWWCRHVGWLRLDERCGEMVRQSHLVRSRTGRSSIVLSRNFLFRTWTMIKYTHILYILLCVLKSNEPYHETENWY